jgi:hypothetical protein
MASRAISVKVPTVKVIKALETKLEKVKADWLSQEANEARYQKSLDEHKKTIIDFAIANIKSANNFRTSYQSWNNKINIDFDVTTNGVDFPKEPMRDFVVMYQHAYDSTLEEINNALNILKMTDEETVNASTMKTIAQYL